MQQVAHQLGIKSAILGIGDDVIIEPQRSEVRFAQFKKVLQEADMCLYCADYLGREANKLTQLNLPYQVAYFGIDYAKFAPCTKETTLQLKKEYNIPLDKVVILNVASPIIRKGWIDLFDALVEIKKTTNNFVLAGAYAGPKDFEILEEVEKRGLTNNFVNIGEIKPENLSKLYNAADIYCMPSHWEGLATVIMESMSSGLAVITTDMCGHPEIVTNGVTGVLIPVKRVDILTTELLELINNKEKRALLGNNARNFIVNKWGNPKENALKLLEKLQTLLTK